MRWKDVATLGETLNGSRNSGSLTRTSQSRFGTQLHVTIDPALSASPSLVRWDPMSLRCWSTGRMRLSGTLSLSSSKSGCTWTSPIGKREILNQVDLLSADQPGSSSIIFMFNVHCAFLNMHMHFRHPYTMYEHPTQMTKTPRDMLLNNPQEHLSAS